MGGTSGWGPPFFAVTRKHADDVFLGQLEWSRNWAFEFTYDPFRLEPIYRLFHIKTVKLKEINQGTSDFLLIFND